MFLSTTPYILRIKPSGNTLSFLWIGTSCAIDAITLGPSSTPL